MKSSCLGILLLVFLASGCGCGKGESPPSQAPSSQQSQELSEPEKQSKAQRESEARRLAVRKAQGAGAAEEQSPVSGSHRNRESQEYGRQVVEHPGAGQERPENLGVLPAASSIKDPADGTSANYSEGSEEARKLNDLGLKAYSVATYEQSPEKVVAHYAAQADGRGVVNETSKHKSITYAVQEGTLVVSVGELEKKSVVTRTLVSKKPANEHVPLWMRDEN